MTPVPGADPTRLLVVCLGNICRSPLAEGALRARIHELFELKADSLN